MFSSPENPGVKAWQIVREMHSAGSVCSQPRPRQIRKPTLYPQPFFKLFSLGRGHIGLEGVYLSSEPKQTYVDLSPRGGQREQVLGNVRAMLKYTLPA